MAVIRLRRTLTLIVNRDALCDSLCVAAKTPLHARLERVKKSLARLTRVVVTPFRTHVRLYTAWLLPQFRRGRRKMAQRIQKGSILAFNYAFPPLYAADWPMSTFEGLNFVSPLSDPLASLCIKEQKNAGQVGGMRHEPHGNKKGRSSTMLMRIIETLE